MEPFILNFGIANIKTATVSPDCKYNVNYEQKTYIDDQNREKFLIENSDTIVDTGSCITKAQTDPTSDESSDR